MIYTSCLHSQTHLTYIFSTLDIRGWNITSLLWTKQKAVWSFYLSASVNTHSLNGRHMLTFTSARDQWVFSLCIWCHLTFASAPSNPAAPPPPPPPPRTSLLLSAVAAERDSLEVSEVFRNSQLQTESGRRNKKRHFDLSGCEVSPASTSLCLPLPPLLETEKYAFKLIFFCLHEWASRSLPPAPNPPQQHRNLNPEQTEHLQAVISLSSPLLLL